MSHYKNKDCANVKTVNCRQSRVFLVNEMYFYLFSFCDIQMTVARLKFPAGRYNHLIIVFSLY